MISTLILDRSIPEVDALVKNWKDGGVYNVELSIRQLSSDEGRATFDVSEVTDLGEGGTPEEEEMPAKPARQPKSMSTAEPEESY